MENPCVPLQGCCWCPLGGGVPLDDTTVEQSWEHLIVTRWRTSDRPVPMQGMLFQQILSRPTNIIRTALQ